MTDMGRVDLVKLIFAALYQLAIYQEIKGTWEKVHLRCQQELVLKRFDKIAQLSIEPRVCNLIFNSNTTTYVPPLH